MRYLDSGKIIVDDLDELKKVIRAKEIDLSLIDIKESKLTTFNFLFYNIKEINGSISDWDISDIKSLYSTFYDSNINPDISKWNTSNVKSMSATFSKSEFNGDISKWDVSNVTETNSMFYKSKFNRDISNWDMSNNKNLKWTFGYCNFDGDISQWKFNKELTCESIFYENKNFKDKYNNGIEIKRTSSGFLEWFKENKDKMFEINNLNKTEIDDYLSSFNLQGIIK